MFARHQPSSPLSTISYTNTHLQTPDHAHVATDLKTPSKASINHRAHQPSPAFPPDLGSSSPPMSSPTSYRAPERPSDRSRTHSSAGLFAARARAIQPPIQRSSSLIQGSGSSGFQPGEGRYGPRPGLRKVVTGFGLPGDAGGASTGYALSRPVPPREESLVGGRSSRNVLPLPPMTTNAEGSIQGSMWKGKFRRRCAAVSRRKGGALGGEGSLEPGDAAGEDEHAEAEHEEIFRRMIQKEQRRLAHTMAVSFEQEVGGSDPAVWEAEVRDAELEGSPGRDESWDRHADTSTPERLETQWQYRSTTKPHLGTRTADPDGGESSANGKSTFRHNSSFDDPPRQDEQDQLAQFLMQQEEEDLLVAEYAAQMAASGGDGDTPGGELGIEMQGFTWEDGPLSDEGDVEMA